MKTFKFTKARYNAVMSVVIFVYPVLIVTYFLAFLTFSLLGFSEYARELASGTPTLVRVVLHTWPFVLLIPFVIGRFMYKYYAMKVIDCDEDLKIEAIQVTPTYFLIDYYDENDCSVKTERIDFKDYGISVRQRKDVDEPIFFSTGIRIFEVFIPYSKEEEPLWTGYEID